MSNGGFVMGIGIQIVRFDCLEKRMRDLKVAVFMNGLFWLVHSVRLKVNYNIIHLKIAMIIGCGVNIMQNFRRKQSMNRQTCRTNCASFSHGISMVSWLYIEASIS